MLAARLGVDIKNLYVSQPDNGEQALEIVEALVLLQRQSGFIHIDVVLPHEIRQRGSGTG